MKKILAGIAIAAVLFVGVVLALPAFVDLDPYKAQVAEAVESHTGRKLTIAGPIDLSILPTLGVRIEDVALANVPGAAEPAMVKLESLTVAVKLLPLLSGEIAVDRFVLERPVVHLEVDAQGNANWTFTAKEPATGGADTEAADGASSLRQLSLGDVRIEDGAVSFVDRRSGQEWTAEDLDLAISLPSLDEPAKLNGDIQLNGRAVALAISAGSPRALVDGKPGPLLLKVDGPLNASFEGTVGAGATPSANGRFAIATNSVTDLAAWAGVPVTAPAGKDLGALDLRGTISWPGALNMDGRIVFGGDPVETKLVVAKLDEAVAGKASPLTFTLAGKPLTVRVEGTARGGEKSAISGQLAAEVPSLRGLAAWAGQPLDDGLAPGKLGPMELTGALVATPLRAGLSKLVFKLDDIHAKGSIAAAWGGRRPVLEADLTTGALDLNAYLPPAADGRAASPSRADGGGSETWSDEPIDVSGLHLADAKLSLAAESVAMQQIRLGPTQVSLQLQGGRADVKLKRVDAYDGRLSGGLTLDASGQTLAVQHDLNAAGVQLLPLLQAVAGFERLQGTGEANYAVAATGNTQRALVSSLSGQGKLRAVDGAIVGINIGAMARNVSGAFTGKSGTTESSTDFAELAGSFVIEKGMLRNDDLRMLAPLFRLSGAGGVDLPQRTLSYRVEPKLAATSKGQGGSFERSGLMVPVIAEGPWANLSFRPDLSAVKPQDVVGTVQGIKKDPKAAVKDLIGGLTGQRQQPAAQPAPAQQEAPAEQTKPATANPLDVLRQLR